MKHLASLVLGAAFFIAMAVTYGGGIVLHFLSSYFFFREFGFLAAFIAFLCPVLSTLAAIGLELKSGNYLYLCIVLAWVVAPIVMFAAPALQSKLKT